MLRSPEETLKNLTFIKAYYDLLFLVDRGYPQQSAVSFVSNHYLLNKQANQLLNRIIFSKHEISIISEKTIPDIKLLDGCDLHIDGYNQFITFFSLKNQDTIILCRDEILRDIFSFLHSKKDLYFDNSYLTSFILTFNQLNSANLIFYLDKQWSHSKKHAEAINSILHKHDISGECLVTQNVDKRLRDQQSGVVVSHDRAVLMSSNQHFRYTNWLYKVFFELDYEKSKFIDFKSFNYSYNQSSKLINSYPLSLKT